MEPFLLRLLNMSFGGAVVIAAILPIRLLLKKAPHKYTVLLWALAAVRLLCPVSVASPTSVTPDVTRLLPDSAQNAVILPGDMPIRDDGLPAAPGEASGGVTDAAQIPETPALPVGQGEAGTAAKHTPASPSLPTVLFGIWAAGCGGMLLYALLSYLRLRRKTAARLQAGDGIYVCDALPGPFVLGVLRPRIFLPSDLPDGAKDAVLAHEKAHIRRRDPLVKLFGFFVLTLHWFNPLVWAGYLLLGRDVELAADEAALKDCAPGDRKVYAEALLACTSLPRRLNVAPLGFGEIGLRARIKNMSVKKKLGAGLAILTVLAVAGVAVFLMTERRPAQPTRPNESDIAAAGTTVPEETSPSDLLPDEPRPEMVSVRYARDTDIADWNPYGVTLTLYKDGTWRCRDAQTGFAREGDYRREEETLTLTESDGTVAVLSSAETPNKNLMIVVDLMTVTSETGEDFPLKQRDRMLPVDETWLSRLTAVRAAVKNVSLSDGEPLDSTAFDELLTELFDPLRYYSDIQIENLPLQQLVLFSPVQRLFTSYYADPRDMDFGVFLPYYMNDAKHWADPGSPDYDPEKLALWQASGDEVPRFDNIPIHFFRHEDLDAFFMKYLGITVGDLRRDWLHPTDSYYAVFTPIYPEVTTVHMPCFAPALDAFYTRTSDYVGGSFRPVGAVRFDGGIWLYSESEVAVLTREDGQLRIRAFLPRFLPR